ncbi:MAG: TonB C-terminal domain-containing protein [Kofleriaceae bacterium]|nr:TonB C-terminal domain-containing protein [Kofleriaceae bacterium]MCL4228572.1 TonB C-terminal domain-containing protein [Myxococcales bacterium]
MSLAQGEKTMHLVSGAGTLIISTVLFVGVWKSSDWAEAATKQRDPLADLEIIDAALAELPKKPEQQPQKKTVAPPPPEKPLGVSRDEQAAPVDRPEQPKPRPPPPDLSSFARPNTDDDGPVGQPTEQPVGAFDGSEFGFGDETRGDPYLGAIKADLLRGWEYPEILSDVGTPVGCLHLEPDGKIEKWELREKSGNFELDDSVERALAKLEKLRDAKPRPVPGHLIPLTRKWICYRMKVKD